jgi:dipeptidyl aminopeptidase/acylaminoacyl peptidase
VGAVTISVLCGCAGAGFDRTQLPEAAIACVHRTREEADRRAELLEEARSSKTPRGRLPGEARVRLEEVGELLGIGPDRRDRMLALLGRLALLEAGSGQVARVEAALRGARPMCWSRDHRRLLFASMQRQQRPQLFEYDAVSREVRPITRGPNAHPAGCYGPDGRLVLVELRRTQRGPESRLLVTNEGGRDARVRTPGPSDHKPVWSPDGSLITYAARGPKGVSVIATVPPDGEDPPRFIARGKDPTFTPDGEWIVYSSSTRGRWRLWRMRPDGSGKVPVGESKYNEHDPAVSPDGAFIVFVAEEPEQVRQRLVVRRFDGSGDWFLLDREEGSHPAW